MIDFATPEKNLEELNLNGDTVLADLGAGTGYYSWAAASIIAKHGGKGHVYAIDVQKSLLERITTEATRRGIGNLRVIWGDVDRMGGTKLADNNLDAVIVSNVLFQAENKKTFLQEATRILKPGGKMMLIDWSDSFGQMGPHPDQVMTESRALELASSVGLEKVRGFIAGAHHWGLILKKR